VPRRSGLGRGLGALIPSQPVASPVAGESGSMLKQLPLDRIRPNSLQPRSRFDEDALESLAASIRELGVLQPVLVREVGQDEYELIAGERRWRASRMAGLRAIPALVQESTDEASLRKALVENLHRADLNPMEEAAAYQQLIEDFGLTHEELGRRVGRSRVAITNTLRLFQLPASVQKLVSEGLLSAGHARALLGTPDRSFQEALARRAITEGLSVRAVEEAVRARNEDRGPGPLLERRPGSARPRPAAVLEVEEALADHLDTRVKVECGPRKGRITIEFATQDDLARIFQAIVGARGLGDEDGDAWAPASTIEDPFGPAPARFPEPAT
jgi:ParB family chromosome partitioning protein